MCWSCWAARQITPSLWRRNGLDRSDVKISMPVFRVFGIALLCWALSAQQSQIDSTSVPDLTIRTTVDVVTTPVTVYDRDGAYVQGLQPEQFHLFDNEKEQNIKVDVSYVPISLVIVLEASSRVESVLPQVQRTL